MRARLDRRGFLLACTVGLAGASQISRADLSAAVPLPTPARWLELFNTHTAERLELVYRDFRGFVAPALERLDWLLRDHRARVAARMDSALYDQLADLALAAGIEPRFEVISAYRSPRTNAALKAAGRGVATRSLHTQGRAIDIRVRGVSTAKLRDLALEAGRGGVGYYRGADFLHLDTGPFRYWAG